VTAQQKSDFLTRFARTYDLPGAAAAAKITRTQAYGLLRENDAREQLDRLITERRCGGIPARIMREYEALAFGDAEEVKPADRMRAMEQLRLLASAEGADGRAPAVVIRVEYV